MNTNLLSQINTTNSIPGLNLLPEKWQGLVLALAILIPSLGRSYHAISSGGGIKGILSGVFLGTNTPTSPSIPAPTPTSTTTLPK